MLAAERRVKILDEVSGTRVVSTEDLSRKLHVSGETIRRDLAGLERQGLLERVHGGAAATSSRASGDEASYAERAAVGRDAKDRIGQAGASLVRRGQTVAIDIGTTCLQMAKALPWDIDLTVATCSLLVAIELVDRPHVEVLVCGGRLRGGDMALSNATARAFFADINPDIAFLGSGGVDAQYGLTDYHLEEVSSRRTILANASKSYVLADSSKFGLVAKYRMAELSQLTGMVTDDEPPPSIRAALMNAGGDIVLA